MNKVRISSIDTIRGIAIIIMISANSFSYFFPFGICPKILRVLFSTAAPIFIFLSGFSYDLAIQNKKDNRQVIRRILQILLIAVFLDTSVWSIYPFFTMDVLYLIAFSLLILLVFKQISMWLIVVFVPISFFVTFFFNDFYRFEIQEIPFGADYNANALGVALNHFLLDGWFPLFPWGGICFLGFLASQYRTFVSKFSSVLLVFGLIFILYFCLSYHLNFIQVNGIRERYCELFYPVSIPFIFFTLGVLCLTMVVFIKKWEGTYWLGELGKMSLPAYFIHVVLIQLLSPVFLQTEENFNLFFMIIGFLLLYLSVFLYLLVLRKIVKYNTFRRNRIVIFLLGC
jgi:uncharacterized membrane protein